MEAEAQGEAAAGLAGKFHDPDCTARGEERARVPLSRLDTLWINTGTLCNITCRNCYIESSPSNDRLVYIRAHEVRPFLDEARRAGTREIGFTGGEPFLNPDILVMLGEALEAGFDVLVLTNAMQPMHRPAMRCGLQGLRDRFGPKLTLRVSLDHHGARLHEVERGPRTWAKAIAGLEWLVRSGFRVAVAGRTCWGESQESTRAGYAKLFARHGWPIDAGSDQLTLFPEMDGHDDVPEITTACWQILGKSPDSLMCTSSRMIVKRKGAAAPAVVPCTLLPYDQRFEMGATLAEAASAHGGMFAHGAVKLCHPNCAKFCVLGGGSCS